MRRESREQGIALITTIFAMAIAMMIVVVFTASTMNHLRTVGTVKSHSRLVQAADGISEQARLKLISDFQNNHYSVRNYLRLLDTNTVHTVNLLGDVVGKWKVIRVSPPTDPYGWVEVAATASLGPDKQTVVRRISFGQSQIFKLAMLSETTNCIYCHLRVHGDVGSLEFMRPGWGTEGSSGIGSGAHEGGSKVYGSVYAARDITHDDLDLSGSPKIINGAEVTGNVTINYAGDMLPSDTDGDGVPDFPPINREIARDNALGSLSGGFMYSVPIGGELNQVPTQPNLSSISRVHNGNLVLIGTPNNPIVVDEDVFIEGDVIIKGVVTGKGAIYAGRNLYVAGDVVVQNPPDPPGHGVCAGLNDPDECARANIAAGKDELRLAARGNMIIGDFTERDENDDLLPTAERQSADYYRSQFGLWNGDRCFDKRNGDELDLRSGRYVNVDGEVVAGRNVVCKEADRWASVNDDAYSYALRPGTIRSNGSFKPWMSDALYKQLLGQETIDHNTWRGGYWGWSKGDIKQDLIASGLPQSLANLLADKLANARSGYSDDGLFNQGGLRGFWRIDGKTLRIVIDNPRQYETQVSRIDAFLYANQRIGGKTSMKPLVVSGGLIAKELGILAPGRYQPWWMESWAVGDGRYNFLKQHWRSSSDCAQPDDPYYVPGHEDCAFTINYDFRLRNGGFGFNLVKGAVGQTMSWKVSDRPGEYVR
ncbi:MAG TPA: hypothetical protein ENK37_11420 [Oceanithermus profundus]|uniref:Type 4 fimbrial biogenesis protein PilX N-terminal domain-containing protein n=1 Tax=Oceanithermus profundus TaxID=187137 RepID=A0A7C4ZIQ6_9DEIN|nr:hypothetical protein [Oceanithermus profundus]